MMVIEAHDHLGKRENLARLSGENMSEQQQTDQNYENYLKSCRNNAPAEPIRIEYETPKLTHHGKVQDLTKFIPTTIPSIDGVSVFFDIS